MIKIIIIKLIQGISKRNPSTSFEIELNMFQAVQVPSPKPSIIPKIVIYKDSKRNYKDLKFK